MEESLESDRIIKLKHERILLQQKTFTKWANLLLEKKELVIDNIFTDLSDGRLLIKLLECVCCETIGIVHYGHQRIHKIDNVSLVLEFLKKSVKLEGIGAEDIVDGKEEHILNLLWTIILRYGISDMEDRSQDAKSVKKALLLWCKNKTKGYANVDVRNFSSSWRNGLAFNALLHHHMPDLFDYHELHAENHLQNLKHAFDVAKNKLGIGNLLDPEDVDVQRPEEKSIMTYIATIYRYFSKKKNAETGTKKISKCVMDVIDLGKMKKKYNKMASEFLSWTKEAIVMLQLPMSTELNVKNEMYQFKSFRNSEKLKRSSELVKIELHLFDIQAKLSSQSFKPFVVPDSLKLNKLKDVWQELETAEYEKERELKEALCRQEKAISLNEMFDRKMKLCETWLNDMNARLEKECKDDDNEKHIDVKLKRHQLLLGSAVKSMEARFDALSKLLQNIQDVPFRVQKIKGRHLNLQDCWQVLLDKICSRKKYLLRLKCFFMYAGDVEAVEVELNRLKEFFSITICGGPKEIKDLMDEHNAALATLEKNRYVLNEIKKKFDQDTDMMQAEKQKEIEERISRASLLLIELTCQGKLLSEKLNKLKTIVNFIENVDEVYSFLEGKVEAIGLQEYDTNLNAYGILDIHQKKVVTEVEEYQKKCCYLLEESRLLIPCDISNDIKDRIEVAIDNLSRCQKLAEGIATFTCTRSQEAMLISQFYSNANNVESLVREKLQLISDMDDRKDKYVCSVLLKKITQIENRVKVKKSSCNALYEKISLTLQDGNMFDKLNLVEIFTSEKEVSNNKKGISDLMLLKQKDYEKKLSAIEDREENITNLFNQLIGECGEKRASLQSSINYFTFKALNDELVRSMEDSIMYTSKTDVANEEVTILLRRTHKFRDDRISFEGQLDNIKKSHNMFEGSFSDNLCMGEIMAFTVKLFNNLCAAWKNLDTKITNKHCIERIFDIGEEITEDLDEQSNEMQCCFDLYNKGYYSEACNKQIMIEAAAKSTYLKLIELSKKVSELSTKDISPPSELTDKVKEIEVKNNNVKKICHNLKDTLENVNGIHAIENHAKEIISKANEVVFILSLPAVNNGVNTDNNVGNNDANVRTILTQLLTLNKHFEREMETRTNLDLQVVEELRRIQMSIETLISLRNDKTCKKLVEEKRYREISYIKKNVMEYCKAIEELHIERKSNCSASEILKKAEEVNSKLTFTMRKMENLQAEQTDANTRNVGITELLDLLNKSMEQLIIFRDELVHLKGYQEFIEKIDTFLCWIEGKKYLAQQQLSMDTSSGKRCISKHKYLTYEIDKSKCVMKTLMDEGLTISIRDHLFHELTSNKLNELNSQWNQLEGLCKENKIINDESSDLVRKEKELGKIEHWVDHMMKSLNNCKKVNCLSEARSILKEYGKLKMKVESCLDNINCLYEYFNSKYYSATGTSKLSNGADFPIYSSLITASKATAISTKVENLELFLAKKCFDAENDESYHQFLLVCSVENEWIFLHKNAIESVEHKKSLPCLLNSLCSEISNHTCKYEETLCFGKKCLNNDSMNAEVISKMLMLLQNSWEKLSQLVLHRKNCLNSDIAIHDVKFKSDNILSHIESKLVYLFNASSPNELISSEEALRQNKLLHLDVSIIKNNVEDLLDSKEVLQCEQVNDISDNYQQLQNAVALRTKQLHELHMSFSFYFEAEGFKIFMVDLSKKLSNDEYGQNFEEVTRLIQRLEIDSIGLSIGNNILRQINTLVSTILEKEHPHKAAILIVQQKITTMWERLEHKVCQRQKKLERARQFHKFNLNVSNLMSNLNIYNEHIGNFDRFLSTIHNRLELKTKQKNLIKFIDKFSIQQKAITSLQGKIQSLTSRYPGKASQKLISHATLLKKVYNDNAIKANNVRNSYKSKMSSLDHNDKNINEKVWLDNMFCKLAKVTEMSVSDQFTKECVDLLTDMCAQFKVKWKNVEHLQRDKKFHDFEEVKQLKSDMEGLKISLDEMSMNMYIKYEDLKFKRNVNSFELSIETFKNDIHKFTAAENMHLSHKDKLFANRLSIISNNFKALRKLAVKIMSSRTSACNIENMISKLQDEMEIVQSLYNTKKSSMETALSLSDLLQKIKKLMMWIDDNIIAMNVYVSHKTNTTFIQNFLFRLDSDIILHNKTIQELNTCTAKLFPIQCQNDMLHTKLTELSQQFKVLVALKSQCEEVLEESKLLLDVAKNFTVVKSNLNEMNILLKDSNVGQNIKECRMSIHNLMNTEVDLSSVECFYDIALKYAFKTAEEYPSLSTKISAMYHGVDQCIMGNKKLLRQRLDIANDSMNVQYFQTEVRSLEEKMKNKLQEVSSLSFKVDFVDAEEIMTKEADIAKELSHFMLQKSTIHYLLDQLNDESRVDMYQHLRTIDEIFAALGDVMKNRKLKLDAQLRVHTFLEDSKSLQEWLEQTKSSFLSVLDHYNTSWSLLLNHSAELKVEIDDKMGSLNGVEECGKLLIQDGLLTSMEVDSKLNDIKTSFQKIYVLWLDKEEQLNWRSKIQKHYDRFLDTSTWFSSISLVISCKTSSLHPGECHNELTQTRTVKSTLNTQINSIHEIKDSVEKLKDEKFYDEANLLSECISLERKVQDAVAHIEEKEERLLGATNLLMLSEKIEELLSWITEQDNILKSIVELDCLHDTEHALSHFEVNLNGHILFVEDLGKYYEACSSSKSNDHQEMMENLMERWKHLRNNYDAAKNQVSTKSFNNDLEKEIYGLEMWIKSKEEDFKEIVITEDESEVVSTNKTLQDFLSNIQAHDDIFEKLHEDGMLDCVDGNVQKNIETLYSRYKSLVGYYHTKQEHVKQVQQYVRFCKDIEIERKWMSEKLPLITRELFLYMDSNDSEKMHNEVKFLNMEFSHRQSHHGELILCGEFLTHENSTFPFIDSAASTLLQFRHDFDHFNNTLRERLKVLREILHVYMLLDKSEDLLKGLNEFQTRLPICHDSLDQISANILLKKFQCINIELQGYWSSIDMLENEFEAAKKTAAYHFVKDKIFLMEKNLSCTYRDISSILMTNETSVKDASNFYNFKAESAYLDKWIQKQIDLISTDGIGTNVEECKSMLNDAEYLARNLIGKEERITAFGTLCHEIMSSDLLATKQIAKNTANIYEMWNDVKDLLNNRLEKLSTGCKLHTLFERIIDVNKTMCQCLDGINIPFDSLSTLDADKKAFIQLQNNLESLTKQLDEIRVQHTLLHGEIDEFDSSLEIMYVDANTAYYNLSQTTVLLQWKLNQVEHVNHIGKEVSQIIIWIGSVQDQCKLYLLKSFQSDIPRMSILEFQKISDELAARKPEYLKLLSDIEILGKETTAFSSVLQEEHSKLTAAWDSLINLTRRWQLKNEGLKELTNISEDLEEMERWLNEQQNAFSVDSFESYNDVEIALQRCAKIETYFTIHDSKIKSSSDNLDLATSNLIKNQLNDHDELSEKNEKGVVRRECDSGSDDEYYDAVLADEKTVEKDLHNLDENTTVSFNDENDVHESYIKNGICKDTNICMEEEKLEINLTDEQKIDFSFNNDTNICMEEEKLEINLSDEQKSDCSCNNEIIGILKKLTISSVPHQRHVVFHKFHEVSDGNGNLKNVELNDTFSFNTDYDELLSVHSSYLKSRPNSPMQSSDDMSINYSSPGPVLYDDNDDDHNDNNNDNGDYFNNTTCQDIEYFLKGTGDQNEDDLEWSLSDDDSDPSDMAPPPASFFELDEDCDIGDEQTIDR